MALLRHVAGACAVVFAGSCAGPSQVGLVELEVSHQRWGCHEMACDASDSEREVMQTWAFVSEDTTQFEEGGVFLFFEAERADGSIADVEIDVPAWSGEAEPRARYTEYTDGEVTFQSARAYGRVQLPLASAEDACGCPDGRLELVFLDPGPDAALDTEDDLVRRIGRARYTGHTWFCVNAARLEPTSDSIEIERINPCEGRTPVSITGSSATDGSGVASTGADGCDSGDGGSYAGDSGGCGTDVGSGSSSSADGCEGSTSTSSSGSGCEGDTSSGGSGCEGDTSSSGSGCSGDTSSAGSGCSGSGGSGCEGAAAPPEGPGPGSFPGDAGVLMSVVPGGRDASGPPRRPGHPLSGPRQTVAFLALAFFLVARRRRSVVP